MGTSLMLVDASTVSISSIGKRKQEIVHDEDISGIPYQVSNSHVQ